MLFLFGYIFQALRLGKNLRALFFRGAENFFPFVPGKVILCALTHEQIIYIWVKIVLLTKFALNKKGCGTKAAVIFPYIIPS